MKFIFCILLMHSSVFVYSQILGCTDSVALNYSQEVTVNDGSCLYADAVISVDWSKPLPSVLKGTSGLVPFEDSLLTQVDIDDTNFYLFHPDSPGELSVYPVANIVVEDWEEVAEDVTYFYMGDFGNNSSGNRQNLRIYKVKKEELRHSPTPESIYFNYELQTDFSYQTIHSTDFDCEAFIVRNNKIYLFTKEWISEETSVYELSTSTGQQTAMYKGSFDIEGLITGSVHFPDKQLIVLSGYSRLLQPFIYLLYDFEGDDFFSGNKRKIQLDLLHHQVEAITSKDGLVYSLTNEAFGIIQQKVHQIDLAPYLEHYLSPGAVSLHDSYKDYGIKIYPNPAEDVLHFSFPDGITNLKVEMCDPLGRILFSKDIANGERIYLSEYLNIVPGYYAVRCWNQEVNFLERILVQ